MLQWPVELTGKEGQTWVCYANAATPKAYHMLCKGPECNQLEHVEGLVENKWMVNERLSQKGYIEGLLIPWCNNHHWTTIHDHGKR